MTVRLTDFAQPGFACALDVDWAMTGKLQVMRVLGMSIDPTAPWLRP